MDAAVAAEGTSPASAAAASQPVRRRKAGKAGPWPERPEDTAAAAQGANGGAEAEAPAEPEGTPGSPPPPSVAPEALAIPGPDAPDALDWRAERRKPHELLDQQLRACCRTIEANMAELMDLLVRAHQEQVWTRFGHEDPRDYFEQRHGIKYRSVRRLLAVWEATQRLPAPDQVEFRQALPDLGTHKAAILAPVIGAEEGPGWREWVEQAKAMTEEALQVAVSQATGAKPRGTAAATTPGERFLEAVLAHIYEDQRERVEKVLVLLTALSESDQSRKIRDPRNGFMALVRLGEVELAGHGVRIPEKLGERG